MIRSGYLCIDLEGLNIESAKDGQVILTIKGLYHLIESNYYKTIYVSNFKVDGIEKTSVMLAGSVSVSTLNSKTAFALPIGALDLEQYTNIAILINEEDGVGFTSITKGE